MSYDCVIIGSGASGLTCALLLAGQGQRVALVEKERFTAPTLRGFRREGLHFDTGFHYSGSLGPGEPLDVYFRHLGLGSLPLAPYDENGFDTLRFVDTDRELCWASGYERIRDWLCEQYPTETKAIETYLREVRDEFQSSPYLNFDLPINRETLFAGGDQSVPLTTRLAELTDNEELRAVLSIHSLLYGVSPSQTPYVQHAKIMGSYYQSVNGVAGGGATLAKAYDAALARAGVDVLCGRGATDMEFSEAGTLRAVRLEDGQALETDNCICTTHPALLAAMVPGGVFRPAYARRLTRLQETPSAYMLFAVADTPLPVLDRSNLILCPDRDCDSFFRIGREPDQGPFYVAASHQPEGYGGGKQAVVVIAPGDGAPYAAWADSRTGQRPEGYTQLKTERLEVLHQALVRACPGLGGIRPLDGATPLSLRDYLHSPLGSLYGVSHTTEQFNPIPATRVPGLYLAGQGTVAPGVMGAVVSAYLACGFMLGHDVLREGLLACR